MKLDGVIYDFGEDSLTNHLETIANEVQERCEINDQGDGDDETQRGLELAQFLRKIAGALREQTDKAAAITSHERLDLIREAIEQHYDTHDCDPELPDDERIIANHDAALETLGHFHDLAFPKCERCAQ